MNFQFTPLDEAYQVHHVNPNTYRGTVQYSPVCVFCSNPTSLPLMNDGGSLRRCVRCKKEFRATIVSQAVPNFFLATQHLKGTN
jgi:hypothetical protein